MTVQNDEARPKRTPVVGSPQSKLETVRAIEAAFKEFRETLRVIDPLKKGETMPLAPNPDRRSTPTTADRRRPRPDRPRRVYLLMRDSNVLDVYGSVKKAFVAAQNLVGGSASARWHQNHPGSWWSDTGHVEIKEFEVKD